MDRLRVQGMTLGRAAVDLKTLRQPGQFYVAMSRVRRRDDVRILNPTTGRLRHSAEVLFYLRNNNLWGGDDDVAVADDDHDDSDNDPL